MTDRYVATTGSNSTGNGTQGNPWATPGYAVAQCVPGDVVHVADGTYTGGFNMNTGGTVGNPITLKSTNLHGAKITNAASGEPASGFNFMENDADNFVIDGFEVFGDATNTSGNWRIGIYNQGSNVVIKNCYVHDILRNATAYQTAHDSGNGGGAIEVDGWNGGTNMVVEECKVANIGLDASTSSTTGHGIYHTADGSVKNCLVYNCSGIGITTWHQAQHVDVVNNTVDGARNCCIGMGSGDSGLGPGTGDFFHVENNICMNSAIGLDEGGQTGLNNTYVNNIIFNCTTPTSLQNGLVATGTISVDPQVVDAVTAKDYHLTATSPAINAGAGTYAPTIDLGGVVRTAPVDVGAYEMVYAPGVFDAKKSGALGLLGAG